MKETKTVLFLGWTTRGRDVDIDIPLMYFFEKILKWRVIHLTIFNLPKVLKTNPDLVLMTNTTGGARQIEVARLVEDSGFPFFSHVSEGMFRENAIEEFVWGSGSTEKRLSENLSMLWSQRAFELVATYYPEAAVKFRVSGAVGFDKYKLLNNRKLSPAKYEKIIGYAGFDFHNIISKKKVIVKRYGNDAFDHLMSLSRLSNKILKYLI